MANPILNDKKLEEARAGWTALEPLRADLTGCLDPAAPIGVLRRPKMGFVVPWRDWIAGGGRQYPARIWARDVLHALAA